MRTDPGRRGPDGQGLLLRAGGPDDLPGVAELYLRARAAAVPGIPPLVHPEASVRQWVRSWDLGAADLWLAEGETGLLGFALATPTWLDHLYVAPDATGRGVGTALLTLLQAVRPGGFGLWVFESNTGARRFYRRHGLVEVRRTDGSDNEERAPDVEMSWPGLTS